MTSLSASYSAIKHCARTTYVHIAWPGEKHKVGRGHGEKLSHSEESLVSIRAWQFVTQRQIMAFPQKLPVENSRSCRL